MAQYVDGTRRHNKCIFSTMDHLRKKSLIFPETLGETRQLKKLTEGVYH